MGTMQLRKRSVAALIVAAAVALAVAGETVGGQGQGDTQKRLDALESGQKEILRQLQEIKGLLQQRPPAPAPAQATPPALPPEPLTITGAPSKGSASAKLVLVEFSDFQCPFCARYVRETYGQLDRDYVATGKVRYVFRHYPLERLHPNAFKAALATVCASRQDKFWPLHDRLFANQQALGDVDLLNHAKAVGIDGSAFQKCVVEPGVTAQVRRDLDEGARAGVTGTPAFFIGVAQKDGRVKVLKKVSGAVPYTAFKSTLDELLKSDLAKL